MNRPLGCLTGTGLMAGAATLLLVVLAAFLSGNGIFSPGALNAQSGEAMVGGVSSHAQLSQDCGACHPAFLSDTVMGDRCLACHTQTGRELDDPASFHFGFANPANCRQCHTDHNGPEASLTRDEFVGFPHERSGFFLDAHPLISQGGSFMCGECHIGSWREFEIDACRACHQSYDQDFMVSHINTFSPACLNCHDGLDTYGADFDHNQTRFPLEGWHELADCGACHAGAFSLEALQQTPSLCYDCHQEDDIHQLRLGSDCGQCHSADGWEEATLDHTLTGFPLEASHADADCQACHVDRQWVGLPDTCAG
ncbi:MAG: cytochrome c3 family protein, partial [Anaerolineales bacterium]